MADRVEQGSEMGWGLLPRLLNDMLACPQRERERATSVNESGQPNKRDALPSAKNRSRLLRLQDAPPQMLRSRPSLSGVVKSPPPSSSSTQDASWSNCTHFIDSCSLFLVHTCWQQQVLILFIALYACVDSIGTGVETTQESWITASTVDAKQHDSKCRDTAHCCGATNRKYSSRTFCLFVVAEYLNRTLIEL